MINNTALKKILKKSIFPFLTILNKMINKEDKLVLLYTANKGCTFCNLTMRTYLLNNYFDKKYKIYCGIESMKYAEPINRVTFVSGLKAIWIFLHAKHVFYTAGQLPIKPSAAQCVIHMSHGNEDIKAMGANSNINNGDEFFFTYLIVTSKLYIEPNIKAYKCSSDNIIIAGDPMCDDLLNATQDEYDFSSYAKFLLWLPTFRQSDYLNYNDSHLDTLVPLFHEKDYSKLNSLLAHYNIKLIVKLHPAQSTPKGLQRHFSHLSVFSHVEFVNYGYDIYKLMAHADGLIGDYSSVSLQYLLLDRPEAFVVPDMDDYKKNRGFAFEHPEDYMGGHLIKTLDNFEQFLKDFAAGKDIYKNKREWVCNQVFKYRDAKSCERIVKLSGMIR